jgi:hypothetical protein
MFDPEKVERYRNALAVPGTFAGITSGYSVTAHVDGVRAEDYDQLLQLYRKEKDRADAFAEAYN